MLMGAMTGLVSAVVGCGQPAERTADTNPNQMFSGINLSNSPTGYTFGLVVDEDRDGTPDYITYDPVKGGNRILYVRPGFEPKSENFIVDSTTRVMDNVTLEAARQALMQQTTLRNSLKAYDLKQ